MLNGKVQHSWGDFDLGGRLFDDLFFQWFLEQNPASLKQMEENGDIFFVHSFLCREIKEYFSRSMGQDRSDTLRKKVGDYGQIQEMNWENFLQRARSFRLSDTLRNRWESLEIPLGRLAQKEPVDLIDWFQKSFVQGWHDKHFTKQEIQYAILTGGSSQWPFVKEIVQKELQLSNESIIRSSRPYAAISEGLAALPALKIKFEKLQKDLNQLFPVFFEEKIKPLLIEKQDLITQEISEQILVQLFDQELKPLLVEFRKKGGAIATLKKDMAGCVQKVMPQIEKFIHEKISNFFQSLTADVLQKTNEWFRENGLLIEDRKLQLGEYQMQTLDSWELPDLYEDIASMVTTISVVIIGSITAVLSGGAGTALIATGPLGLVIGLLLGAVVSYLALRYGASQAKEMAETWEVSPWIIGFALSDGKIENTRTGLLKQIREKLSQALGETQQSLLKQLEEIALHELKTLSELNQL